MSSMPRPQVQPQPAKLEKNDPLIPSHKVGQFIQLLAGNEKCDANVLQLMSSICAEFVVNVVDGACQVAKLKENKILEDRDIRMILGKHSMSHIMYEARCTKLYTHRATA